MKTNLSEKGSVEALLAAVLFGLVGFAILYVSVLSHMQGVIIQVVNTPLP